MVYRVSHSFNRSPLAPATKFFNQYSPTMALWGVGAGTAALFLLSVTPIMKTTIFEKVPGIGWYFRDNTPESDKAF